jgi:RHS repeat-associated protein
MSVLGAFYFISTHNGSTDIVTNADGAPVARFVYEPFGKVNSDLTDLDPDRNGVHYGETFMFTGQEFEPETGLYNYKARIYDPETGRFLQPDPVHTDQPGQDNWDRYQYVWNNPVNFVDPDGEAGYQLGCDFPVYYIYGRYSGPGACRQTMPGKDEMMLAILAYLGAGNDSDRQVAFLALYYKQFIQSPPGKTEVDEGSRIHDRDGARFTAYQAKNANSAWIRNATSMWAGGGLFGPIPTKRGWDKTFSREKRGLGTRYAGDIDWGTSEFNLAGSEVTMRWKMHYDFTPVVAAINTMYTLLAEWVVTVLGTVLFGTVNSINEAGHWMHKQTFTGKNRTLIRSARSNRSFMRHQRYSKLFMPQARYNNLTNPGKWRL